MTKAAARTAPSLLLEVGQYSHTGQKRTNNEDWLGTFRPRSTMDAYTRGSLFLVADGMGGHKSGELASRQAVDQVIRYFAQDTTPDVEGRLRKAIESANDLLYRQGGDEPRAGRSGTTLVAALVYGKKLWIANVGDSRAYLLRDSILRQMSKDHTFGGEMGAALGENWIGRHVITRALGVRRRVEVDVYAPVRLENKDRIVLCTDGLTGAMTDAEIGAIAGSYPAQEAAERLVNAANENMADDNVSVIVVAAREVSAPGSTIAKLLAALTEPGGVAYVREYVAADRRLLTISIVVLLLALVVIVGLGFVIGLLVW